jgi:hypothetical protein
LRWFRSTSCFNFQPEVVSIRSLLVCSSIIINIPCDEGTIEPSTH